ncbi:conserved exported hypothetical protein [Mesorhizobium prunaredense]|uniref:EF-hand domain-containing protein n=1 Tax=Mesorhizobium prunaredense TaxID=1631249 RepID=A0A1R3VIW0_9HYPH|nr:hypothetical protein [Mesorhizobium prunaredense]SIT58815.1 conserved exported hypothetical protein [Mesorhizobium prunaredense]
MNRRSTCLLMTRGILFSFVSLAALTKRAVATVPDSSIDDTFARLANNEGELEGARAFTETEYRQIGPSSKQRKRKPSLPRRWQSDKQMSKRSQDLIVLFEVTGKTRYEKKYRNPIWPKGKSGITFGIGYDIGYSSEKDFEADWSPFIDRASIDQLRTACGKRGSAAAAILKQYLNIDVPWDPAYDQFVYGLRFYAGEVIAYFPNADQLSPDCFGALVSLVYNRGSSSKSAKGDPIDRRREIREIKELMLKSDFASVPEKIREMKRIWKDDPDAKGLLTRRELEAAIFEKGLS